MSKKSVNFASNVIKLATGSAFAQILAIVVAPILTRLFAPDAFGLAALFVSIATIIGILACLRYELSIMLPEKEEEAANLLGASIFFVCAMTLISMVVIFFAGNRISAFFGFPQIKSFLWLIPVSVLVNGFLLAASYWDVRAKRFGKISLAKIAGSSSEQIFKIASGFMGYVSGAVLIYGYVIGRALSVVFLGRQIIREDGGFLKRSMNLRGIAQGIKRYKKFPIFTSWSLLLNSTSLQMPVWVLMFFFAPAIVGFYAIGDRVLRVPVTMVGQSVSQVFLQKAAELKDSVGALSKTVEGLFKRLVALSIVFFAFLAFNGKDIFVIVFGTRWAEAGIYVQILSVVFFLSFVTTPFSTLFSILEKQDKGLIFNLFYFIVPVGALICGGMTGSARTALVLFAVSKAIIYVVLCLWMFRYSGVRLIKLPGYMLLYGVFCLIALMPMMLLKLVFGADTIIALTAGIGGMAVYYFYVFRSDEQLKEILSVISKGFSGATPGK